MSLSLVAGLELYASVSQRGVRGEVRFTGAEEGSEVQVTVNLEVAEGSAGEYTWGIYEFPIDYTQVGSSGILFIFLEYHKTVTTTYYRYCQHVNVR
jgi:hypothetical protein